MPADQDVTLPFESAKTLPDGHTILAVRIRDLPRIVDLLERLIFSDEQETFSIRWVPRESLNDANWDKVRETKEQRAIWETELGVGVWDTWKGDQPRPTKHRS